MIPAWFLPADLLPSSINGAVPHSFMKQGLVRPAHPTFLDLG